MAPLDLESSRYRRHCVVDAPPCGWGAASGIPQAMAALTPRLAPAANPWFVSLKLSAAKMILMTMTGRLLCGLSLGREDPSVQIAAGVAMEVAGILPTIGLPDAVVLQFARCDQLAAKLAPAGVRPCWAQQEKMPRGGIEKLSRFEEPCLKGQCESYI